MSLPLRRSVSTPSSTGAVFGFRARAAEPDPEVGRRMAEAVPHRGDGHRVLRAGHVVLGLCGRDDGRAGGDLARRRGYAAAFTGSLDNREALAARLDARGEEDPDAAAVVALAFDRWGSEAPLRMRGVFASVVTDGTRLWAFRDHVGFRPLFYREDGAGTYVATEAKQVVAGAGIAYEPDLETVELIFWGRLDAEVERCALRGIRRLPPACILASEPDAPVRVRRYWHPERLLETSRLSLPEVEERFHELMERAVARCLTGADVLSLSGGIDSTAVAAYAAPAHREATGEPLPALTSVFPHLPEVDESHYVATVAEELGLRLHTFVPRARPTDGLARWMRLADGPVPVISLSEGFEDLEKTRELGGGNLLGGDLAEFVIDMRGHLLTHLLARGKLGPAYRNLRSRLAEGTSARVLALEVAKAILPTPARALYRRLKGDPPTIPVPGWLDPGRVTRPPLVPGRKRWELEQLAAFQGPALSFEADDAIQGLTGVGARRPFADVDLWEFFLGLPAEVKFPAPRSKALVRSFLRGRVPDVVLDRRDKTVFDAFILARVDYEALRSWIPGGDEYRMPGVDYAALADRLDREALDLREFMWAKDLAGVHAFLSFWESASGGPGPATG